MWQLLLYCPLSADGKYKKLKSNDINILVDGNGILSLCLSLKNKQTKKTLICEALFKEMILFFSSLSLSKFLFPPSLLSLPATEGNLHDARLA